MVNLIKCDIFQAPIDILVHQANCYCTMGSGIALDIKTRFPEAYEEDCKTKRGDETKLGTASICRVKDSESRIKFIFNMYGQYMFGGGTRHTNYEAYYCGLEFIKNKITNVNLIVGIPFKMGCSLGGGDWNICEAMIKSVFESSPIQVFICQKEEIK